MIKTINAQSLLNVATGTIKALQDRALDMGINSVLAGIFESEKELTELFVEWYPWNLDENEQKENVEELIENGYVDVDSDEIDTIEIRDNNKLYVNYRTLDFILNLMGCLIYDTNKKDFLIGFSNTGWPRIDGAIDLAIGSVGYYNSIDDIYTPVFYLLI